MQEKEESLKSLYSNNKLKWNRLVRFTIPSDWDKKAIKLYIEGINTVMNDINIHQGYQK